jgi:hypothetical protein
MMSREVTESVVVVGVTDKGVILSEGSGRRGGEHEIWNMI